MPICKDRRVKSFCPAVSGTPMVLVEAYLGTASSGPLATMTFTDC